jgi:hypothetical protein
MQAMNGFVASGGRRGRRLVGCAIALVAFSAMMLAPSIAGAAKVKPPNKTYIGLGDSLAFGYSQQLFNENEVTFENPSGFEHGYVSDYHNLVNKKGRIQLVNYGCPGETTESLIGDNATFVAELNAKAAGKVSEPITGEAPCAYHTVDGLPLHNEYGAGKSQLEATLATIATDKAAGAPVKMISLDIGANDELHEVAKAEKEATKVIEEEVGAIVKTDVFNFVEKKAKEEVETFVVDQVEPRAFEETDGVEPKFAERIAVLAGEYSVAHATELTELGDRDAAEYPISHATELEELGLKIAGEYEMAHGAELKARGEALVLKLITAALPAEYAQIDTNILGIVTAIRDSGYKGRIIFEGTYDPYGRVGGVSKEHKELEPGFNAAAAELISLEESTFSKKSMKVCYSNAEAQFNTALSIPDKESYDAEELALIKTEEEHLQDWTNMANFTVFDGKTYGQSGADGPDIHATPKGYEEMAKQMNELCKF